MACAIYRHDEIRASDLELVNAIDNIVFDQADVDVFGGPALAGNNVSTAPSTYILGPDDVGYGRFNIYDSYDVQTDAGAAAPQRLRRGRLSAADGAPGEPPAPNLAAPDLTRLQRSRSS
jgi:hypothetical protein